jgi:hypothetical protein
MPTFALTKGVVDNRSPRRGFSERTSPGKTSDSEKKDQDVDRALALEILKKL